MHSSRALTASRSTSLIMVITSSALLLSNSSVRRGAWRVEVGSVASRVLARHPDLGSRKTRVRFAPGIAAAVIVHNEDLIDGARLEPTAVCCKPCVEAWQWLATSDQTHAAGSSLGAHAASFDTSRATAEIVSARSAGLSE
jgi:hypothetical protein